MPDMNSIAKPVLPGSIGMVLAAGGGAGLALGVRQVFGGTSFWLAVAAIACVVILWGLGRSIAAWRRATTGKPLAGKIAAGFKAASGVAADAGERARIDDLRKRFEAGVAKFKEAGKDLYSLPWYLLVGEPGSGKSEAVRHAQLPFPPGLNEPMQGAGGTINMDWWFTNRGIILDTAGRYVAGQGKPAEWKELLGLLRRHRPHCPINGLILAIPADALIRDNADAIQAKAERLAEELDSIRRALDVRFPVYVLVTKSDKIYGFREFFDIVDDPQVQHSILGWSYDTALDAPFDPKSVDRELARVRERLERRRAGMMLDPAHTIYPDRGRRIDELDALFAFPESIAKVGSRLRWYLQSLFVAGAWSQKPVFLRGVYFTSSMRTGDALDEDLAAALGIGVDDLPEGKVFETERAFFLRDLFVDKVFKERGLVTHASQARRAQARRKRRGLALACLVVLALIGLTVGSAWWQERDVQRHRERWVAIAGALETNPGLMFPARGFEPVPLAVAGEDVSLSSLLAREAEPEMAAVPLPAFRPAANLVRTFARIPDPETARRCALRAIVEARIGLPLLERTRVRLAEFAADDAEDGGQRVARERISLLADWRGAALAEDPDPPGLEPLVLFVLADDEAAKRAYERERGELLPGFAGAFAGGGWKDISPELIAGLQRVLVEGTESQAASIEAWATARDGTAPLVARLRGAARGYATAEGGAVSSRSGGDGVPIATIAPTTSVAPDRQLVNALAELRQALAAELVLEAGRIAEVDAGVPAGDPADGPRPEVDLQAARDAALLAQTAWSREPRALEPAAYPDAITAKKELDEAARLAAAGSNAEASRRYREAERLFRRAIDGRTEIERTILAARDAASNLLREAAGRVAGLKSGLSSARSRLETAERLSGELGPNPADARARAELDVHVRDIALHRRLLETLAGSGIDPESVEGLGSEIAEHLRSVEAGEPLAEAGRAAAARAGLLKAIADAIEPMVAAWERCEQSMARWGGIPAEQRGETQAEAQYKAAITLAGDGQHRAAREAFEAAAQGFDRAHATWALGAQAASKRAAEEARAAWEAAFGPLGALGMGRPAEAIAAGALMLEAEAGAVGTAADAYTRAATLYGSAMAWLEAEKAKAIAPDGQGMTPLHHAAREGRELDVRRLLAMGAVVDAGSKSGATPIWLAAGAGHVPVVRMLVEGGANVNGSGEGGMPLTFEALRNPLVFRMLVQELGARTTTQYRTDTLLHAVARVRDRNPELVEADQVSLATLLIEKGANVNATNGSRDTPLDVADQTGSRVLAQFLRQRGGTSGR